MLQFLQILCHSPDPHDVALMAVVLTAVSLSALTGFALAVAVMAVGSRRR